MDTKTKPEFSPLCDVHHVHMRRVMLEEDSAETRSYHACQRRDCTRIFRAATGYSDIAEGQFDESRRSAQTCRVCGATLFLAEVNDPWKTETWECSRARCKVRDEFRSPASR